MNKILAAAGWLPMIAAGAALAESATSEPDEDLIEEVVVIGREFSLQSSTVDVKNEVVTDTSQALRNLPGSDFNGNGPLTGIAQHRGMFGDRVSVAVDGMDMISGGPNAMDTPLSYSSPMLTDHIIVERGIAGVGVAPETIGGHMTTSLSRGEFGDSAGLGMTGFASARYADNGDVGSTAARLTAASDRHRLSVLAGTDRGDHVSTPAGDIIPSEFSRNRFDVSYGLNGERSEFVVFVGKLDTTDAGTPALAMDIRRIDTTLYGMTFSTEVSDRFRIDARASYNDVEHWMDNFSLRPPPGMPGAYRQNFTTGEGGSFAIAGTFDVGDASLTAGIDGRRATHTSDINNPNNPAFAIDNFNDVSRDLTGVFVEWRTPAGDGDVELGVRYNSVSADAGVVGASGMMGMMGDAAGTLADAFNAANRDLDFGDVSAVAKYRRPISDSTVFVLELGSKTRAPAYQELFLWLPLQATGGLADGRNYIGNLGLDSERSNEINVGFDASYGAFQISPHVFYKDVRDFIQGTPSDNPAANMLAMMMSGNGALQFSNVDARIYGADVAWGYRWSDALSVDGVVSYARGKRTDVSDNLYRLAPLNGSIGLNYTVGSWRLRPEVMAYARQDDVSSFNAEQPTAGYGIVNFRLSWRPLDAWTFDLHAHNLFDNGYQDHLAGINRVNGVDIPAGERLYGRGRTITAGFNYRF